MFHKRNTRREICSIASTPMLTDGDPGRSQMTLLHRPPAQTLTVSTEKTAAPTVRIPAVIYVVAGTLAAVLIISCWHTLRVMVERWSTDPQYSHGFLVPIFALG